MERSGGQSKPTFFHGLPVHGIALSRQKTYRSASADGLRHAILLHGGRRKRGLVEATSNCITPFHKLTVINVVAGHNCFSKRHSDLGFTCGDHVCAGSSKALRHPAGGCSAPRYSARG